MRKKQEINYPPHPHKILDHSFSEEITSFNYTT